MKAMSHRLPSSPVGLLFGLLFFFVFTACSKEDVMAPASAGTPGVLKSDAQGNDQARFSTPGNDHAAVQGKEVPPSSGFHRDFDCEGPDNGGISDDGDDDGDNEKSNKKPRGN